MTYYVSSGMVNPTHSLMNLLVPERTSVSVSNEYGHCKQWSEINPVVINPNKCKKLQFIQTLTATCSE